MRRLLVVVGLAWVGVSLAGAWVAIDRQVPYDFAFLDRAGAADQVEAEWVHGWGSGLAVPLAFLVVVTITTIMAVFGGSTGRLGSFALAVLGAVAFAYTLTNQATHDRLTAAVPDRTVNALILANLALSALLVLLGMVVWVTTPRSTYR